MTAGTARGSANPIDRLWRLVVEDRTLFLVAGLLGLAIVLTLILPQIPSALVEDEAAARWMAQTSGRFGSLGAVMQQAGLFDLWNSPWLQVLLGIFAFILLVRLAQATGDAAKRLRQRDFDWLAATAHQWPLTAAFSTASEPDATLTEMSEGLRSEGWQVTTHGSHDASGSSALAAERSAVGLAAAPAVYLGLIVILAGLWLGRFAGWQETGLTLVPGQPLFLEHAPRTTLLLDEIVEQGLVLNLFQPDGSSVSRPLTDGGRARLAGLAVEQTAEGLALAVSARDANAASIPLQALEQPSSDRARINLVFDQPRAERSFLVPDRQLAFNIVAFPQLPQRGFEGPTFLVQAFAVGEQNPVFDQFLAGDSTFALGDDLYELRSGRFLIVSVSRNPGRTLVIIGALLAIVGLLLAVLRPIGGLFLHLQPASGSTEVASWLLPSPLWREGSRWLAAWTGTYTAAERSGREE